jgi:primosomal protein N'
MIWIVTCHTAGCDNCDIGIEFLDPAPTVFCGPCGIEITDKVEQTPTPKAKK